MEKIIYNKILYKPLTKSGIPVICKECYTQLYSNKYERCSKCGAYLCEKCILEHSCK